MNSVTYEIRTRYASFSAKEKQIADYILEHPEDSVNPSIDELSACIEISESTLVRFVRKLGYSGYQQFRIALAQEVVAKSNQVFEVEIGDSSSIASSVFNSGKRALEETLRHLDQKKVDEVVSLMLGASHVYLFGLGGSAVSALDAYHKFIRTGISCFAVEDFHMQLMQASQSRENDVALIFSHMGSNYDVLGIADELKRHGTKIVTLTSNDKSPLAKRSDFVLQVYPLLSKVVAESFSARLSTSALVDVLYVEIVTAMDEKGIENLNNMRDAIAKRRI